MKKIDCQQGTLPWFEARRGIPTASKFGCIVDAKGKLSLPRAIKDRKAGVLATGLISYMCELLAERITPTNEISIEDKFPVTPDMEHGNEFESSARNLYEFDKDLEVYEVGFCLDDSELFGCSPDGLIYDEVGGNLIGGLELKCPKPKTHIKYLLDNKVPDKYIAQVHGALVVTGAPWWDFMSYHKAYKPLYVRTYPNEFTENLRESLIEFCAIMAERYEFVRPQQLTEGAA